MQYIADAAEAKEIDRISIQDIGIPSLVLMERAALRVADCVSAAARAGKDRILAVCGMGNNGGDGVAAARILKERGFSVSILLLGNEEKASGEMKQQLKIARHLAIPFSDGESFTEYTVILDAIFGIGLSRGIGGKYAAVIQRINQSHAAIVSVDIPSGVDAGTGKILGIAVQADYTVTFGVNKRGLVLFPGMQYAGEVIVENIGFPEEAVKKVAPKAISYGREDLGHLFPKRIPRSNKGSYGKTLVVAGSRQISGAAYFAAAAAYRLGCGLVKAVTHENNRVMLQAKLPEALLLTYSEKEEKGTYCTKGSGTEPEECQDSGLAKRQAGNWEAQFGEALQWADTVVIGPGLGRSQIARYMLYQVLQLRDIPVVIDADGINLLSGMAEYFTGKREICLPPNFVLTPHIKEMSRLIGKSVGQIQDEIAEMAYGYTKGAVLVLKDARTVVSDGERMYINLSGNNALAKGGSGDVLSGIIGGLLARGMAPFDAASLGVCLHGFTAEEYVKGKGYSSMLASDILDELTQILP